MTTLPSTDDLAEDIPQSTTAKQEPKLTPPAGRGRSLWIAFNSLLCLSLLAAGVWLYQQFQQQSALLEELKSRSETNSLAITRLDKQPALVQLQAYDQQLDNKLAEGLRNLQQQLSSVAETAEHARTIASRNETSWSLAEIEYLLRLGSLRLQLLDDVDGAITAFTAADAGLHRLNDVGLLTVRKQLGADIAALRLLPRPDIPGIAIQLTGLLNQVPLLPQTALTTATTTTATDNNSTQNGFWNSLKRLVVIRKNTLPGEKIPPSANVSNDFRDRLIYALSSARNAALRGDTADYQQQLQQALQTLQQQSLTEDDSVNSFRSQLLSLQNASLRLQAPDTTQALELLKQFAAQHTETEETTP